MISRFFKPSCLRFFAQLILTTVLVISTAALPNLALGQETDPGCSYQSADGSIKHVKSRNKVPFRYRKDANCRLAEPNSKLARPADIELGNSVRVEKISSEMGTINMRWPRSFETLIGRTPLSAMTDAARTIGRTLKTAAFPSSVQNIALEWNVVFMDENLPDTQIPHYLVSNCHPGWMTPNSISSVNIYLVGQRIAAGCGNQQQKSRSVADSTLTEVLLHEMGHGVEFFMLGEQFTADRMRAEGFATWFEMYSAKNSSYVNSGELRKKNALAARQSFQSQREFTFAGTGQDYARAAMYFAAIEDRHGVRGIMAVYQTIVTKKIDFFAAVKEEVYWDREQLEKEAAKVAEKY